MKLIEYCQQIKHLKMPLNDIYNELEQRPIKRYLAIIHDKDILNDGTHKPDHLHVMMELQSNQHIEDVAKWFKDEPQYFEKPKTKGKFAYNNMVSYALHLTDTAIDDGKYQYELSDVKSNFNVSQLVKIITSDISGIKLKQQELNEIYEKIMNNEIPHSQLGDYFSNMEWKKHLKDIEDCYKIRNAKILQLMEEGKEMNVIYMTGKAGTGKTTYAKIISKSMGYHFYVTSSGTDPLGEYDGQECIILDDLRKENFSYSELLKFLDNNTHSFVKSRYSNKCPYNCKLLIITSVLDPKQLYQEYELSSEDSLNQLTRRISLLCEFSDDMKNITMFEKNENSLNFDDAFVQVKIAPNPIVKYLESKKKAPRLTDVIVGATEKYISVAYKNDIKKIEEDGLKN